MPYSGEFELLKLLASFSTVQTNSGFICFYGGTSMHDGEAQVICFVQNEIV